MNCKQGDLAYLVTGPAAGVPVRCVERYDGPWYWSGAEGPHFEPGWRLDRKLPNSMGTLTDCRGDRFMRPISPGEGDDETLTWAGKPNETPADVIREAVTQ